MEMNSKFRILFISSRPPQHSADLGNSIIKSLVAGGHKVDFLTRYDYRGRKDNEYFIEKVKKIDKLIDWIRKRSHKYKFRYYLRQIKKYFYLVTKRPINPCKSFQGLRFIYEDEAAPCVPVSQLLKHIKGPYDAVITLFWEDMLNSTSLKAIYEKLKCPILIYSPDMAPMTGGCYYFGKCTNFTTGCGKCPALNSKDINDISFKNFSIKKDNYYNINCAFLGNTWMNQFAISSGLFKQVYKVEIIIDEDIFFQNKKSVIRKELSISDYQFVILLRSIQVARKGIIDSLQAIKIFLTKISIQQRKRVLIISIGDNYFHTMATNL